MSAEEFLDDSADKNGEGGDAEAHVELTPEQKAARRRTMESVWRSLASKIQPPEHAPPESTLTNIAAVSGITEEQQAMMTRATTPFPDAQPVWLKQITVFNSDIFQSYALTQSNLNPIVSQLARNIDFGIAAPAARTAAMFVQRQEAWLNNIAPAIAAMRVASYPPNLRSIEGLQFEEIEQVVMVDGIPLYGLPRTAAAGALIRAGGASKRREVLGRRWRTISADCRTIVQGCTSGAVAPYVPFAVAALDALDAGHTQAAQALAGSLVDAILNSYFGNDRYRYTPDRKGKRTKDGYDEFSVRQFFAFAPMWQAYQQFFAPDGDKVPTIFSRHATAHTVSPRQFNRRNATQALMIVCSLLYRLDEEAATLEAAEDVNASPSRRGSGSN